MPFKECSHITKFSPLFLLKKRVARQQIGMFTLKQFQSIYWVEWVVDSFAPKFCPLIQNNIGPNFGDRQILLHVYIPLAGGANDQRQTLEGFVQVF